MSTEAGSVVTLAAPTRGDAATYQLTIQPTTVRLIRDLTREGASGG